MSKRKKEVIVLRGPCGAGKTTLRKRAYTDYHTIDMADAPRDVDFDTRLEWLEDELAKSKSKPTVVEGIFAPDSPSLFHIRCLCKKNKWHRVEVTVLRDIELCLAANKDDAMRTKFIKQYHPQFH